MAGKKNLSLRWRVRVNIGRIRGGVTRSVNRAIAETNRSVGMLWAQAQEEVFEREGPGWRPLSPWTIAERARLGFPPGPMLVRTGSFKRSATTGAMVRYTRYSPTLSVTTVMPRDLERYNLFHYGGESTFGRRIPPRPLLPSPDSGWLRKISSTFFMALFRSARSGGG